MGIERVLTMKANTITLLLALAGVACAGEMKLLNDHLRITLPDGAEYFNIPTGLMEADTASDETAIRIGEGNDSIRIRVEEKHYLAEENFAEGVKAAMANLNREGNYFDIAQEGDNLVYAVARENTLGEYKLADDRLAPVAYAEYRHPDGTVQKFTILAGSGPLKDAKKCQEQVKAWLKSVKPGGTPLTLQERVEHQVSYMKDCRLAVPVPQGFSSTMNDGDGFHFVVYAKLAKRSDGPAQYSVQVGDHPQVDFRSVPAEEQTTQNGTLLGKKVEWHLYQPAEDLKCAECVLPLGCRGDDVTFSEEGEDEIIYLHITIYAKDAESRANLIRQAEKITLEKA